MAIEDVNADDVQTILDAKKAFGNKLFNISPEDEKFLKRLADKSELTTEEIQRFRNITKKCKIVKDLKEIARK